MGTDKLNKEFIKNLLDKKININMYINDFFNNNNIIINEEEHFIEFINYYKN